MASVAVVVFTRDLRVDDHPALARAVREAERVVPLFVFDDTILGSSYNRPNRTGFLVESLVDLDDALRALGGALVVRRGEWVREVAAVVDEVGADSVHVSDDVSGYARARFGAPRRRGARPDRARAGDHGGRTGRDHAGLRPCRRGRPLQGVHAVLPPLVRGAPSPRGARAGPRHTARRHRRGHHAAARRAGRRRPLPGRRAGGRQRRARPARGVDRVGAARLRRPPRRPARRCHVAPLAVPPLRVPLTTGGAARRRAPSGRGSRCVRAAAVLARLLRAGPRRPARRRVVGLRRPRRPLA